jgi:hypothetical protein
MDEDEATRLAAGPWAEAVRFLPPAPSADPTWDYPRASPVSHGSRVCPHEDDRELQLPRVGLFADVALSHSEAGRPAAAPNGADGDAMRG